MNDFFKQMTLLNSESEKKQNINHSECDVFPSLQAGVLKFRGRPAIVLRKHVLKGTSSSKIRNRPTELGI